MRFLGIDPGTGRTGWAVVDKEGGEEKMVDYGCLETTVKSPLPERLEKIYEGVSGLVDRFKPDEAAVEELYFATNAKTAMSVGQSRGVVVLALTLKLVPVYSYTPLQVKLAVTGYGQADKAAVQQMVQRILGLKEKPKPDDAADALALALTHGAARKQSRLVQAQARSTRLE